MSERGISAGEVEEVLANVFATTPGNSADRINRWGRTRAGRRPRITTYRANFSYIITVVEPTGDPR